MKRQIYILFLLLIFGIIFSCSKKHSGDYYITPVPFTEVKIDDDFWSPRMETNRKVTIPYAFKMCEETGRISNFAVAGGLEEGQHEGRYYNDSDVFKVIEGAAYSLSIYPDPELEKYVDEVIDKIAAAQEDDGYLYTARTLMREDKMPPGGEERWSNIIHGHELYNVGHMYEGAVAYYQATGKRKLLNVSLKNADLINSVFGPNKKKNPPGHQEIEISLGKLYRLTGEQKYLDLAKFFLDQRGDSTGHKLYDWYSQDHLPVCDQEMAVGHAVRAAYMYTGMADIAALTGNDDYVNAIQRIWKNVVGRKLYITGGIGAAGGHEGFADDYVLPNLTAYCETCASIANAMWNHRMFLMLGDSKYMDMVERVIYNSFLSGISMKGDLFFYPNRLESLDGEERKPWFGTACCPSNIVRFIPSLPGYIFAQRNNELYINLYIGSSTELNVNNNSVQIKQETKYPWEGKIEITVDPETENQNFTLNLRIPGWAQSSPAPSDLYKYLDHSKQQIYLQVNGEQQNLKLKNGYAQIKRKWNSNDIIELEFPMSINRVIAHESVLDDAGKVTIERGPIVFCAEGIDQKNGEVVNLLLDDKTELKSKFDPDLLNGIMTIYGKAKSVERKLDGQTELINEKRDLKLIPYYAWAHRDKSQMAVWLAREIKGAKPLPAPTIAYLSKVTSSHEKGNLNAIKDQFEPVNSIDHNFPYFHWWPRKGTTEWVQYDFQSSQTVSLVSVYWFDDTGMGQCRIPESWQLFYKDGGQWKPVENKNPYNVEQDEYNQISFEPVKTSALRLEVKSQKEWAGGIHEWIVK